MKRKISITATPTLAAEVAGLHRKPTADLKRQWRVLFGIEPPRRISRDLLIRAVAYRIQENVLEGLKPSTRRLLAKVAAAASAAAHRSDRAAHSPTWNSPAARVARYRASSGRA
jgi:hypothetical protein